MASRGRPSFLRQEGLSREPCEVGSFAPAPWRGGMGEGKGGGGGEGRGKGGGGEGGRGMEGRGAHIKVTTAPNWDKLHDIICYTRDALHKLLLWIVYSSCLQP